MNEKTVKPAPTPHGEEPPCPITHRPYFMHIEHPELGDVPTYGGPFDSYTTPEPDEDGHFRSEHYCHDRGDWIEGGNPEGLMLITEREYNEGYAERDQLRATLSDQATYGAEQLGKLNQRVRDLEGETFRLRGVVMEKNTALSAAWAEMAVLENKLRPRLTKNEPPTEADAVDGMVLAWSPDERQDFWAEYGWKQVAELDQSSGDVSFKYWMPYPDRPEWPISALSPPSNLSNLSAVKGE